MYKYFETTTNQSDHLTQIRYITWLRRSTATAVYGDTLTCENHFKMFMAIYPQGLQHELYPRSNKSDDDPTAKLVNSPRAQSYTLESSKQLIISIFEAKRENWLKLME